MTSKALGVHPLARNEASEAFIWYRQRDDEAAKRFQAEVDRYFAMIEVRPLSFQSYLLGTRRCVMQTFPYQIIFQETRDVWFIVAVAHSRRKPGYWRRRLKRK
jgi:hypothetical protein